MGYMSLPWCGKLSDTSSADRFLNALWQHEIERINDHLPKATSNLKALLMMERPELPTRGGSLFYFEREHLEFLARELPEELHYRVMLPIILTRRLDLGKGVFSIGGGRIERRIVHWMLGEESSKKLDLCEGGEELQYVYRPQVSVLISKHRTLFAVGFV